MSSSKLFLVLCFVLYGFGALGQDMTTAGGGDASGSGGSLAVSIGQIVYSSINGANGSLHPGNQQPYEIFALSTTQSEVDFALAVYPNPTSKGITFEIEDFSFQNLSYELIDPMGKILESNPIRIKTTSISMEGYASSMYFLRIIMEHRAIKEYKVIKN